MHTKQNATSEELREFVYLISERYAWLGIGPDIASMTTSELEGVYRFLLRVSDEQVTS